MGERIINGYKRLFEVRILHHYWLDEGATVFDLMPQKQRDNRLLSYDMRPLLAVTPTATTAKALISFGCIYKNTALGCIVAAPGSAKIPDDTTFEFVIPDDTTFEFVITVQKADFYNYTALTLQPQNIYELYHQPEDKTYRYKENVPVLSNLTGASRDTGSGKNLFLSKNFPAPATNDQVEALVSSGNSLLQLTGDQPGAGTQELNALATKLPVFVHQGDVPALVPPAGLVGAPRRGVMLSGGVPDDVFALIRLSAKRADDPDFDFVDGSGHAKTPSPIFQIRFKNRSTIWKYLNKSTSKEKSIEASPLPLTYFGNAGTKQKPSAGLVKADKSGMRITKLISEIYV